MQTALSQQRCLPASTSGRCSLTSFDCSEDCPGSSGRLLGRLAKSRTLLLRRGSALRGSYSRRCSLLPACCQPRAAGHVGALQIRSSAAKRDVRAQARSTAGQVGVAAVEEVVDAPHPEVLSYSSLPVSFAARTVRDSYLSVQNVESLTRELAEVGEHLERLVASEDTPSSRAYSESEMSEEDYKRLQEARRQHEDELKARRELRAIRRKASQAKAAAEKAATAAAPMVTSSNPVRERTRSGVPGQTRDGGETAATSSAPAIAAAVSTTGAGARGAKAAAVKAAGRAASARTPTGARVTAAARTRSHASWGKRHVEKPTKDAFQRPAQSSAASATNTTLYAVTKMQGFGQQSLLTAAEEKVLSKAVQRLIAMEAKQTEATQRLGRPITEREWAAECGQSSIHAFRKAVKVGQEARTRMMKSNERLVFHVARRYMNRGLDFQDLLAEGMSGLWRGVEKFDADRGFKFSTYAHWWVRQAITRAISEQGRVVRLPVHLHELMAKVTKVDLEYQSEHGRRAGNEKLAELVGISQEKLAMLSKVYMAPTSFNAPVGGSMDPGADTVGETIADDNEASPEEVAVRLNLHQDMDNVLATLSERESGILRCRYGLDDGRQRTLEEVGQIFKVTRERIRQIEAKAILKLRQPDRSSILYDYVNGASTQSVTWRGGRSKCHSS